MATGVKLERGVASRVVNCIVDSMFDQEEVFLPVVLVEVDKMAECGFNKVVFNF